MGLASVASGWRVGDKTICWPWAFKGNQAGGHQSPVRLPWVLALQGSGQISKEKLSATESIGGGQIMGPAAGCSISVFPGAGMINRPLLTRNGVGKSGLTPVLALVLLSLSCSAPPREGAQDDCGSLSSAEPGDGGWQLLFGSADTALAECHQQAIYTLMRLALSPEGDELMIPDVPEAGPVSIRASFEDLDGDGDFEVFLVGGNTFLSGGTGSSVWLFLRPEGRGDWQMALGFPAAAYSVLAEGNLGYPDLRFAGMGWCEAVWRWNGSGYEHLRNVPTAPGGCDAKG